MDHNEMIEKLSRKVSVSHEEAQAALEQCDWDILDALVLLEGAGKAQTTPQDAAEYTTQPVPEPVPQSGTAKQEFLTGMQKLWRFLCKVFRKGNQNNFVISRYHTVYGTPTTRQQEEVLSMPITVLVLLVLFVWPMSAILLFVGLFCGLRYKFSGPDFSDNNGVNQAMDKAANSVQKGKEAHQQAHENHAQNSSDDNQ